MAIGMKKILALSLIAILIFASALCAALGTLPASAAKGDNLAAGKTPDYQPHKNSDGTLDGYNTDLTDGKIADTFNWADGSWFAFQIHNNTDEAGYGVLTVDLGQTAAIGQVRVHTLFADGSNGGVGNPGSVMLEFSVDNVGWQTTEIKEYEPSTEAGWNPKWIEFNVDNIDARYVRLTFEQTQAFVMIDEVEVLEGEKTVASEPPAESSAEPSEEPSEAPSEEPSEEPSETVSSDEPSEEPSDEPSEPAAATSEATSAASSETVASTASSAAESDEEPSKGNGLLIGLVCAGIAVAVAVAVVVVRVLRKRKG